MRERISSCPLVRNEDYAGESKWKCKPAGYRSSLVLVSTVIIMKEQYTISLTVKYVIHRSKYALCDPNLSVYVK
jgi:hypothetical protein